ncbi:MAG: PRC-barrel domain-containing protein [Candidatus Thermoplasmatota archaeon]|nr:PRC-barrel domain-containing protein [Candidatus Thermoplasmatota archaeon]
MNTILYSEMIRKKVDTPVEGVNAKLVDILARQAEGYWEANEIKIETGLISSKGKFFSTEELRNIGGDTRMKVGKPIDAGRKNPSDENELYLSRLDGRKVNTFDGRELGRIYDYELYIDSQPWKVWKLLIDPTGLSPLKRRVRIPTKHVKEVKQKVIILKEEYEGV